MATDRIVSRELMLRDGVLGMRVTYGDGAIVEYEVLADGTLRVESPNRSLVCAENAEHDGAPRSTH